MRRRDGLRFELDSVRFTVLHPDTTWADWQTDLNEDSVVLLVEYGEFRALFAGDAGLARRVTAGGPGRTRSTCSRSGITGRGPRPASAG